MARTGCIAIHDKAKAERVLRSEAMLKGNRKPDV